MSEKFPSSCFIFTFLILAKTQFTMWQKKINVMYSTGEQYTNSRVNFYISIKCYVNICGLLSVLHG